MHRSFAHYCTIKPLELLAEHYFGFWEKTVLNKFCVKLVKWHQFIQHDVKCEWVREDLFHSTCFMRTGNLLKSRVSDIPLKRIRVNQGLGVHFIAQECTTHSLRRLWYWLTKKGQCKFLVMIFRPRCISRCIKINIFLVDTIGFDDFGNFDYFRNFILILSKWTKKSCKFSALTYLLAVKQTLSEICNLNSNFI